MSCDMLRRGCVLLGRAFVVGIVSCLFATFFATLVRIVSNGQGQAFSVSGWRESTVFGVKHVRMHVCVCDRAEGYAVVARATEIARLVHPIALEEDAIR